MVEDMERDRTRRTYLERAEEEAKRICESKAAGSPGGTCWNGEGTVRRKQPWLMGEGLGMSLPSFPSDKATCRGRPVLGDGEISDHRTPRKKSKKVRRKRSKRETAILSYFGRKKLESEGKYLIGQRVYHVPWPKKKWWERMQAAGGMPDGVDVAHTEFGDLVLVPVNETYDMVEALTEGKVDPLAPEKPLVDREGRSFWIPLELKERVARIFGAIRWRSPLMLAEVEQFGVRLSG